MIDAVGNPQTLLLLGGTSDIGLATVERFASDRPMRVILAGRPGPRLDAARARLEQHRPDRGHERHRPLDCSPAES